MAICVELASQPSLIPNPSKNSCTVCTVVRISFALRGRVRTMTNEKGETFFVGKDVAKALGYSKPQNALRTHVDKEDKSTAPIQGTAYETRVIIINESGLYSLILSSQLAQAKVFKRLNPYNRTTVQTVQAKKRQVWFAIFIYLPINIISKYNIIYSRRIPLGNSCTTCTVVRIPFST